MKKNFFKKLSFILALAMIVTALAPATGVFAAAKAPKLNASSKYLYLDVEGKNEYDFNIKNKQSGWKYLWASANKDVVTVNKKNGVVTATGAGSTKVSVVISDKDGEEVDELTAKVTVRDNIKELTITNTPAENKLAVGASNDFNRSYVTVAGNKKGSKGVTRWSVTDKDGKAVTTATISDAGVFTATAAGEYTISARAFQSKAKYTSWLSDSTKFASYVTSNVATYKVTVAPSIVKVEQVDLDSIKITFDSAVTDAATKLAVAYMAGAAKVNEKIKAVSMDATNKIATVDMYLKLTEGATYIVEYPGMKEVQFVAATSKLEDVTGIAVLSTTAEIGKKKDLDIALYNKDGVNIIDDELKARVQVTSSNTTAYILNVKDLYMNKIGDTTTITATFHTWKYADGKEVGAVVASGVVTCVEVSKEAYGMVSAYTVQSSQPGSFTDVKHTIAANDTKLRLWVQLKGKNAAGDELLTVNKVGEPDWSYTSSDTTILSINSTSGDLWAAKEGSVVIVVKYKGVQVGALDVHIAQKRRAAFIELDTDNVALSNVALLNDTKSVGVKVKDQLGDDYNTDNYTVKAELSNGGVSTAGGTYNTADKTLDFTGNNATTGTYYYTVKVTDTANSNLILPTNLTVSVSHSEQKTPSYYKVEFNKAKYDMKVSDKFNGSNGEKMVVSLFGYSSNNVKIQKADLTGRTLEIRDGDGTLLSIASASAITSIGVDNRDRVITLVNATASASGVKGVIQKQDAGQWVINVLASTTLPSASSSVEVKDTQAKATLTTNKNYSSKTNILDAVNDCFDVIIDGNKVYIDNINNVGYNSDSDKGKQVQIDNLTVYKEVNAGYDLKYKVSTNNLNISYNP